MFGTFRLFPDISPRYFTTFNYPFNLKIRAFILLLCLSIYYLDIVAAVDACQRVEEETSSCNGETRSCKEESSSCEEETSCKEETSSCGKASTCNNNTSNSCPSNSNDDCTKVCITCPFFSYRLI